MGHIKENYPKRWVTHAAHVTVTEDPSTGLGLTIEAPHGSLGGTEQALAVNAQPRESWLRYVPVPLVLKQK